MHITTARPELKDEVQDLQPFNQLPANVVGLVFDVMRECTYDEGECLIREGDPADCLLLLLEGEAQGTIADGRGGTRFLASYGPGDIVGEMALVTDSTRMATIDAKTPVRTLRLEASDFRALAAERPEVAVVVTHIVADRLGERSTDGLHGKLLDKYRIVRAIARGGMAVVYEAVEDEEPGRRVALKMMSHRLLYQPGAISRFQQEADVLIRLDHPGVARVYRRFEAHKTHFIVMEYCDGPDLKTIIETSAPLPESAVRAIVGQVVAALTYLHGADVIHRDVKPGNLVTNSAGVVKLVDFGLAKPLRWKSRVASTEERTILGTMPYMAPEQFAGEGLSVAVDIYALGCMAFELLTGLALFDRESFPELIAEKTQGVPRRLEQLPPSVSPEMREFIHACLARDPADRTPDLAAVAAWARPLSAEFLSTDDRDPPRVQQR